MTETMAAGADQDVRAPEHGNAYNIFILVLTVFSLAVMVLLILPLDAATLSILRFYDNIICVVFLIDFAGNLAATRPKREYFITKRGWLDLIGSIPSFGVLSGGRPVPHRPPEPPRPDHPAAARQQQEAARRGRRPAIAASTRSSSRSCRRSSCCRCPAS